MNSEYRVKTVYGPHPTPCYGNVLVIDPLLPPKKCPYNCVFCPLGETVIKTSKPGVYAGVERVAGDFEEFLKDNGVVFEKVLVWGFGDPLLNYQLPAILNTVKNILAERKINAQLVVKTTGLNIGENWVFPIYEIADEVVVQLSTPPSLWKVYSKPVENYAFEELVERLTSIDKRYRAKMSAELVVFKINGGGNFEEDVLRELISVYSRIGFSKVYVTTLDRPAHQSVKPVNQRVLEKIASKLADEGVKAQVCSKKPVSSQVKITALKWLFNHVLRMPLSTMEVLNIYGEWGLAVLNQMVKNNLISKISWEGQVFFKARYIPLQPTLGEM